VFAELGRKYKKMAKVERWWEVNEMETPTVWQALVTKDGLDYYYNTETQETSWEKPEELMTEDEINSAGEWLWVPHQTEVYVAGKVLEKSKRSVKVQSEDGQIHSASTRDSFEMKRSSLKRIVEDLTLLDNMSAPLILNDLRRRFENEDIYTNVGTILISINPYERYDIYSDDVVRRYIKARMANKEMPPHVFNTGHDAFYGVTGFKRDQSVIISGESGAGKTEATKQCLKYLATIAGSVGNVEKKLLQANPILEAFGNAKTLRNDNSSRFGKYMEVFFNGRHKIIGSQTTNYLLEKVRVIQQTGDERNFHIFYQLCKGAPKEIRKKFHLKQDCSQYRLLSQCWDVDTIDDVKDFEEVQVAFKDLNFDPQEVKSLWLLTD